MNTIEALNYQVYASNNYYDVSSTCDVVTEVINKERAIYETCQIENLENLGTPIKSGVITQSDKEITLTIADDRMISVNENNPTYYYVVIEYPNLDEIQNVDSNSKFTGSITIMPNSSNSDNTIYNDTTFSISSESESIPVVIQNDNNEPIDIMIYYKNQKLIDTTTIEALQTDMINVFYF